VITSVSNPRVQALRKLAKRAFREQRRAFVVEGVQAIGEALRSGTRVEEFWCTPKVGERRPDLLEAARDAGCEIVPASEQVASYVTQTVTSQGALAVVGFADVSLDDLMGRGPRLLGICYQVRDPGNAGSVLRVADAAGADGVVFTEGCVDVYNAKTVRSSAGSVFHVPHVRDASFSATADACRRAGIRMVGTDAGAEKTFEEVDLSGATALVFGNEAWGLPGEAAECVDVLARIPIYGKAESLNLATAVALVMYEAARSQRSTRRER